MQASRSTSAPASSSASEGAHASRLRLAETRGARLALVAGVGLLAGCSLLPASCQRQPIVVVDVVDRSRSLPGAPRLESAALRSALDAAIGELDGFVLEEGQDRKKAQSGGGWQLELILDLAAERGPEGPGENLPPPGKVQRVVGLGLGLSALQPVEGYERRYETQVLRTEEVAATEAFEALLAASIREAVQDLSAVIGLARAREAEVVTALGAEDAKTRARAADVARERRLQTALPALMELVRDEAQPREVALKSVGALLAIGDPVAVPALIDAGRRRPPQDLAPILFAVGTLGGREAEAYLFTVQSGHPDPGLREAAKDALLELERRQRASPR